MILSNVGIQRAIAAGEVVIEPVPGAKDYDSTSVNLRLGDVISVPKLGKPFTFDLRPGGIAPFLTELCDTKEISDGYPLPPNKFILASTLEYVKLPLHFAARVEGKSSFARCGLLVHFTAPTIHAGFNGNITLELINLGPYPILLYPNLKICQLIIERVEGEVQEYKSQFHGQTTPEGVKRK